MNPRRAPHTEPALPYAVPAPAAPLTARTARPAPPEEPAMSQTRTATDHLAEVLRLALPEAIADYHRMLGPRLRHATLPFPLIDALKWLCGEDRATAVRVLALVLDDVRALRSRPPHEYVVRSVVLSLHLTDSGWTPETAAAFVHEAEQVS
ncbi:hypothetical protein [Streptomyces sp. NBC_01439]|uniref:hypothetical protein n=1 Tax=Streptomyces sp. NBC_01439 TaxID=2903867 RepID=UPI002E2BFCA3|nr:hypothetical protein [Streptomyces sp. NBC_01439]